MKGKIIVVGLGPGGVEHIPPVNLEKIKKGKKTFLRTGKHPGVGKLPLRSEDFYTFDYLYEEYDDFDEVCRNIVEMLFGEAEQTSGEVVYAVPGNPLVAEASVELLIKEAERREIKVDVYPAVSSLEAVYTALKIDPAAGIIIKDALKFDSEIVNPAVPLLLLQIYSPRVASDLKISLRELYADDHPATLVRASFGQGEEKVETVPLHEIDRIRWLDHLTSLYLPGAEKDREKSSGAMKKLVYVMDKLRGPEGCPWDREQTHESLKRYLIEEAYEVIEAVEEKNMEKLQEELGDLLLQVIFHARLAKEKGLFTIEDVIRDITEKMIRRHPHVFSGVELETSGEVMENWEKIKEEEKKEQEQEYFLEAYKGLPGLLRAEKVQNKASQVGFDWSDISGPWQKIHEELKELEEVKEKKDEEAAFKEMGDMLFALVNCARFMNVNPEEAMTAAVDRFIKRFHYIEEKAQEKNLSLKEMSLEKMDNFWDEAKKFV